MYFTFNPNILPIPVALGYSLCPSNWEIKTRIFSETTPNMHEFIVVLKGRLKFVYDGVAYYLGAGETFAISSDVPHSFHTLKNETCGFYWIHFLYPNSYFFNDDSQKDLLLNNNNDKSYITNENNYPEDFWIIDHLPRSSQCLFPITYNVGEWDDYVYTLFENSLRERSNYSALSNSIIGCNILNIFFKLSEMYLKQNDKLYIFYTLPNKPKLLNNIINYFDDNYCKDISIKDTADKFNISHQYLIKLFKSHLMITPVDYVNKLKIEQAKNLMRNENLNISETAYAVGIDNISYFSRLFKKYENISPSQYKKKLEIPNNQ